jgi:ribonuclease-3
VTEGVSPALPELDSLRAQLGIALADEPLRHALTHSTWAYENGGDNNERLEFLGDAVLGQSVTLMLYTAFPDLPEGELAKRRAAVVSTQALASVAETIHLGSYLLLGRGEELTDGRAKPSLLADALEAVIGAVFLSEGAEAADRLVKTLIEPLIQNPRTFDTHSDPKTALQEWLHQHQYPAAQYQLTGEGPDHDRVFTAQVHIDHQDLVNPVATGVGSSKKAAEVQAAAAALAALQG